MLSVEVQAHCPELSLARPAHFWVLRVFPYRQRVILVELRGILQNS